jgi:predicted ArsR family transcriptional regulator
MSGNDKRNELTQKIYEFIKARGCATIEEIAQATGVSTRKAYTTMRTLFARRLVLPYRPNVGRERMYCIPDVGDKLYGRRTRSNTSGMICITLPVDLIETVDEIATSEHKTRSSVIKEALIMMINSRYNGDNQQKQPEEQSEDEGLDLIAPDR